MPNRQLGVDLRLDWNSIYIYSYRAYFIIIDCLAGKDKKELKIVPKAYIGYLIGYKVYNLYRI